jgi:hypothetical protein
VTQPRGAGSLRDLLFADLPPDRARDVFLRGGAATAFLVDLAGAAEAADAPRALQAITRAPAANRETRLRLQAWHLARLAGVQPPAADARLVLGCVVDMHLEAGLDTLAGFADGSARYLNHSGAGVVWEVPDMAVGQLVRALLDEAAVVIAMTQALRGPRPPAPGHGGAMITVLTAGGIHAIGGSSGAVSSDPRLGPVIEAASALLALLVERAARPDGGGLG